MLGTVASGLLAGVGFVSARMTPRGSPGGVLARARCPRRADVLVGDAVDVIGDVVDQSSAAR